MMKRIFLFITSMPFMALLFILLAFSMGAATFIESSSGTEAARALVYNTHWFELIWALLAVNLINNLFKYKLLTKRRLPLGIFHLSFLIIVLGAAVTRYFSFEGSMHIREGEESSSILTYDNYFVATIGGKQVKKKVLLTETSAKQFSAKFDNNGNTVKVKTVGFISNAERKIIPSENGMPVIDFVISLPGGRGMQSLALIKGKRFKNGELTGGFETDAKSGINFFTIDGNLVFVSQYPVGESSMTVDSTIVHNSGDTISVGKMQLYNVGNYRFLVRNYFPSATVTAVRSNRMTGEDAVFTEVSEGNKKHVVTVFGRQGEVLNPVSVPLSKDTLHLAWGAVKIPVPFSIYLKDFRLERYSGSNSPSSYESEVVLRDKAAGVEKNVRIFMNNTLSYKGYKLFQSSYDTDEKGTILSVNHDMWGTWITYIGYALLTIGIIFSLISKNSHFRFLSRKLKESSVKVVLLIIISGAFAGGVSAQPGSVAGIPGIDKEIVKSFSRLWVQGNDGRIEPVSTLSGEIVRKISKKSSLYGKSPDEVILSMMTYPELWRSVPVIKVSNKTLAEKLGANKKYISVDQLFDEQGNYKIAAGVQAAYSKKPALRNRVEKEYLYVDERINIVYMIFRGSLLNIFPRPSKDDVWYSPGSVPADYSGGDSLFIKSGFKMLTQSIADKNNDDALMVLKAVENFQQKYAKSLLPSETRKDAEIFYNKFNPFKRIFPFYLAAGLLLLFILFVNIFRQKQLPRFLYYVFGGVISLSFLIHTGGLILRWYISGHAPWSNGFESVVYVAWATMLAGFIFGRKYPMVLGTSSLLAGISLFVAFLSWMNPEVTNLVPVLKSYWLTIHVAVITASYGFIGLSAFLGIMVLILIVLRKESNAEKVSDIIGQLTTINEMSATVGLYFLTIGTFLGAVWANESWGRYWGWDPKETWSLVTIVVYSFVVHMRLIPALKGAFNFNLATVFAFASVIMTYFGVNYYLTGLHSYGKGSADGINPAVIVVLLFLSVLIILSYAKEIKYNENIDENNDEK